MICTEADSVIFFTKYSIMLKLVTILIGFVLVGLFAKRTVEKKMIKNEKTRNFFMINRNLDFTDYTPFEVTVFLEDTDSSGSVYHGNYLKFLERARTTLLYHQGISHAGLIKEKNCLFVVHTININFLKPAFLEDRIKVYSIIDQIKGAAIHLRQFIVRDNELLLQGNIILAYIQQLHHSVKLKRIPKEIASALSDLTTL